MREDFLHYIWANGLYKKHEFTSNMGKTVEILHPGKLNKDAGPDFFNSRIRVGNVELAGNIEIHIHNSDWYRHGHHTDGLYNNVILSVVKDADMKIYNSNGQEIDTIVLENLDDLYNEYLYISKSRMNPGCHRHLLTLEPLFLNMVLPSLTVERLERKCGDIRSILDQTNNDWDECFYRMMCKYWAGNVNSEPFYQLAHRLPYRILLKHGDKLHQLESLLLGVAGLLEGATVDDYVIRLKEEYNYLSTKYQLENMPAEQWKFMRVRPDAFPSSRLALLASFLQGNNKIFSRILDAGTSKELMKLLDISASTYWDTHYQLGKESITKIKRMGENMKRIIIINSIVPLVFLYGKVQGNDKFTEKALKWLEETGAEDNYIVRNWEACGFKFDTALQTQALIQLSKEYCEKHECLHCKVGREVFKSIRK